MLPEDLDLGDVNPDTVQAVADANGLLPPGKYHVKLEGASEIAGNYGPGTELEYVVLGGPFTGAKVKDTVWTPGHNDGDKEAKTKNRFALFAHRLGLLTLDPKTKRYVVAEGKTSFGSCLGAEIVIEVSHRTYDKKDGSGKGTAVNVTFGGIWALTDPKVKDVPRAGKVGTNPVTPPAATTRPRTPVSSL